MINLVDVKLYKSGICRIGGRSGRVFVIGQTWDYYHDEYSEGQPELGPDGLAYYALYGFSDDMDDANARSPTCLTEQEAVQRAETLVGPVLWNSA